MIRRLTNKWWCAVLPILWLTSTAAEIRATADNPVPTLVRWAFWLPPKRMAEFDTAYTAQILPLLRKHGFVEADIPIERVVPDSVFSRLFVEESTAALTAKKETILADIAWQTLLL